MGTCSALLVHGAGGGAWEWNLWRGVLEAHAITVHVLELRPAAAGLVATGLGDYRTQVQEALQALPSPRVLIGASLGGLLATMCADQADALVLVNPFPPSPWHLQLPGRDLGGELVPWRRNARLASTRDALRDADDAGAMFAFRHWRDESAEVLRAAYAGIEVEKPVCPVLLIVSAQDQDVPPEVSFAIVGQWQAELSRTLACSHVGPLLGRNAPDIARKVAAWLNGLTRLR